MKQRQLALDEIHLRRDRSFAFLRSLPSDEGKNSANGAASYEPGATPQEPVHAASASAESAIRLKSCSRRAFRHSTFQSTASELGPVEQSTIRFPAVVPRFMSLFAKVISEGNFGQ